MEEQVGVFWHRLITRLADKRYPHAIVRLSEQRNNLGILFRALGGDSGLRIETADADISTEHLNWLQRLAGSGKRVWNTRRNEHALLLPPQLAVFKEQQLNRELYTWLTAMAACSENITYQDYNNVFDWNQALTIHVLQRLPGLRARYLELAKHHIIQRPAADSLKPELRKKELLLCHALEQPGSVSDSISQQGLSSVPLWLSAPETRLIGDNRNPHDDGKASHHRLMRELEDVNKRKAERINEPDKNRGLVTVRMENIFTMGEFVNVDRGSDDEDDIDRAEDVARDLERLSVSRNSNTVSAMLKFDLDLPASDNDDAIVSDDQLLPEWDWKSSCLVPDHCRVVEMLADTAIPCKLPDHLVQTAKRLRKLFQSLAPSRHWHERQVDGQDIDIDALIRYRCERLNGYAPAEALLYRKLHSGNRNLSCLLLADLSLSTDTWINDHYRVIDVIRDSLFLFAECLHANGDRFAMHGFSSRRRDPVRIHRLKGFDESYGASIRGRIAAIKPGYYTRLGAGIRYASQQLMALGSGHRLLLVVSDGKPNDLDQYEGRYGIEDTRQAVLEARRLGLLPFCVTIDTHANQYLPYLFGKHNYVVIRDPARLPHELPKLYALLSQN